MKNIKLKIIVYIIIVLNVLFLTIYQKSLLQRNLHMIEKKPNLIAQLDSDMNEDLEEFTRNTLKQELSIYLYPVGSIYMSTEDDTVEKVQNKFGGKWQKYGEGTTLVSANSTYPVNSTGGSETKTLTVANLPSHNHSYTPSGKITSSFSGSAVNTNTTGNAAHTVYGITYGGGSPIYLSLQSDGNLCLYHSGGGLWCSYSNGNTGASYRTCQLGIDGTSSTNGNHYHSVTAAGSVSSSFAGTATTTANTGSTSPVNVLNPYIVVYMYKRIS